MSPASIWDLQISVRAANALDRNGIATVPDLLRLTKEELAAVPGVGIKAVNDVLESLDLVGLSLRVSS